MKRDWTEARRKVEAEGRCRRCGTREQLEAAHIAPRSLGGGQSAASLVPLCSGCHRAYDSHRLDLIGYLHPDEQIEAVRVLGLARAYRRLGGFVDA